MAVALNPGKTPLFELADRVELAKIATQDLPGVEVEPFDGLLVEYVKNRGAQAIIRGLRAVSDFEHEFQMALLNRKLDSNLETLFLMASEVWDQMSRGKCRLAWVVSHIKSRLKLRKRKRPYHRTGPL